MAPPQSAPAVAAGCGHPAAADVSGGTAAVSRESFASHASSGYDILEQVLSLFRVVCRATTLQTLDVSRAFAARERRIRVNCR